MNDPVVLDDYATPEAAVLEPEVTLPPPRKLGLRKAQKIEFYKPFHYLLLIYLFFYCSRIPEMVPALHTGVLLQPLLLIGMIMTSTSKTIFRSDVGRLMTAFTAWVALCVPFAVWRGGAYDQFVLALQALALLFFMAAFIRTTDDCYRVMFTIALAMGAVGVLSLVIGGGRAGSNRLGLGSGSDTLSDANFLALFLIVGLPFLWFSASRKRGIMKIALICMVVPVLASAARTGSRSGLLAFGIGMVFFLIFATAKQRAIILGGGLILIVCATVLLPPKIMERFTTYFQAKSAASEEAAESAAFRKELLTRSLVLTFEHPLFGVGPGEFMDAEAKDAAAKGQRGVWHYTHNSYTELSSECGIIGLVLYVMAFWRAYRGLSPIRDRYPKAMVRRAAMFVQIAILMSAIGAFFLSIAYGGILYAILGLSMALQMAVARDYKEMKALASEPEPAA